MTHGLDRAGRVGRDLPDIGYTCSREALSSCDHVACIFNPPCHVSLSLFCLPEALNTHTRKFK